MEIAKTSLGTLRRWSWMRAVLASFLAALLTGCAWILISDFDQSAYDRTLDISKNSLSLYQQLLQTPAAERRQTVQGPLKTRYGDIETQIRLHLLQEQARVRNKESAAIAENLLKSWQEFSKAQQAGGDALSDGVLIIQRGILERHLRSALVAEEAKKLGSKAGT